MPPPVDPFLLSDRWWLYSSSSSVRQTKSPFQHPAFFSYLNFQRVVQCSNDVQKWTPLDKCGQIKSPFFSIQPSFPFWISNWSSNALSNTQMLQRYPKVDTVGQKWTKSAQKIKSPFFSIRPSFSIWISNVASNVPTMSKSGHHWTNVDKVSPTN